jgi:hypothetical protein
MEEEAREVVAEESGDNPMRLEDAVQRERRESTATEHKALKESGAHAGSASR